MWARKKLDGRERCVYDSWMVVHQCACALPFTTIYKQCPCINFACCTISMLCPKKRMMYKLEWSTLIFSIVVGVLVKLGYSRTCLKQYCWDRGSILNWRGYWIRQGHTTDHFNIGTRCIYWIMEVIELDNIVLDMFYCSKVLYMVLSYHPLIMIIVDFLVFNTKF